jgi:hypothetical protein
VNILLRHAALTYNPSQAIGTWAFSALPPGQTLRQPAPLFNASFGHWGAGIEFPVPPLKAEQGLPAG